MNKQNESVKAEFGTLYEKVEEYISTLNKLKKYPGNQHYKKKIKSIFLEITHAIKKIKRVVKEDTFDYQPFFELILKLIDKETKNEEKEDLFEKIELSWQDLCLDMENLQVNNENHNIPSEIPFTDVRFDLEEAIRDLHNGCYLSAIVMCRRAYEGALISKYKQIEGKEPVKQLLCKNCKNVVKGKLFIGIVELHKWAVENKIISDKFKDIGFLVPNLGAGGAHPIDAFPRDPDVANVSITTTVALLKQVYS